MSEARWFANTLATLITHTVQRPPALIAEQTTPEKFDAILSLMPINPSLSAKLLVHIVDVMAIQGRLEGSSACVQDVLQAFITCCDAQTTVIQPLHIELAARLTEVQQSESRVQSQDVSRTPGTKGPNMNGIELAAKHLRIVTSQSRFAHDSSLMKCLVICSFVLWRESAVQSRSTAAVPTDAADSDDGTPLRPGPRESAEVQAREQLKADLASAMRSCGTEEFLIVLAAVVQLWEAGWAWRAIEREDDVACKAKMVEAAQKKLETVRQCLHDSMIGISPAEPPKKRRKLQEKKDGTSHTPPPPFPPPPPAPSTTGALETADHPSTPISLHPSTLQQPSENEEPSAQTQQTHHTQHTHSHQTNTPSTSDPDTSCGILLLALYVHVLLWYFPEDTRALAEVASRLAALDPNHRMVMAACQAIRQTPDLSLGLDIAGLRLEVNPDSWVLWMDLCNALSPALTLHSTVPPHVIKWWGERGEWWCVVLLDPGLVPAPITSPGAVAALPDTELLQLLLYRSIFTSAALRLGLTPLHTSLRLFQDRCVEFFESVGFLDIHHATACEYGLSGGSQETAQKHSHTQSDGLALSQESPAKSVDISERSLLEVEMRSASDRNSFAEDEEGENADRGNNMNGEGREMNAELEANTQLGAGYRDCLSVDGSDSDTSNSEALVL